ncbi:MAG: hypothetical protein ABR592_13330 [Nitriliruptorales bacterium]
MTSTLRRFRPVFATLLVVLVAAVGGCGQAEDVRWRDVTLELPSGWVVNELDHSRLSIANARFPDLDASVPPPNFPSDLQAAVFFTHEPNATAAAWRALVAEQHGTLDEDIQFRIDGAPATRLVFTYDANGTLTREMVVLIPARELVGLFQPITPRFSQDGPALFDQYRPMFDGIVESMDFGAPLRAGGADIAREVVVAAWGQDEAGRSSGLGPVREARRKIPANTEPWQASGSKVPIPLSE